MDKQQLIRKNTLNVKGLFLLVFGQINTTGNVVPKRVSICIDSEKASTVASNSKTQFCKAEQY